MLIHFGKQTKKIFKRLKSSVEVLNRDPKFVSLFKNHQQIEHSGVITVVGRHLVLLDLKENLSLQ